MGELALGRLFVYFSFLMENKQNTPNWRWETTKHGLWSELLLQVIEAISTGWSGQDILSSL